MKLGTYAKETEGFKIELIHEDVEYAVGTTEACMFTLRMGAKDEGLIMFLDLEDMQDFSQALHKAVDDMRVQMMNKYLSGALGKEFEF